MQLQGLDLQASLIVRTSIHRTVVQIIIISRTQSGREAYSGCLFGLFVRVVCSGCLFGLFIQVVWYELPNSFRGPYAKNNFSHPTDSAFLADYLVQRCNMPMNIHGPIDRIVGTKRVEIAQLSSAPAYRPA